MNIDDGTLFCSRRLCLKTDGTTGLIAGGVTENLLSRLADAHHDLLHGITLVVHLGA